MKKILLSISLFFPAALIYAQTDCADIFMSEHVEGWNNNKAVELYNPTPNPITLDDNYRLIRYSNGSTTSDQELLYNLPLTGTIAAFSTWVIIQDTTKPGQDTMVWPGLRKKANWLAPYDYGGTTPGGNCVFWNGDDAVSLQKKQLNGTWKDIDIFGEIGVRPKNWQGTYSPSGAWTDTKPYVIGTGRYLTKSKTLVRKHTVKYGVDRITMSHYGDSTTGGVPNSFYALKEYDTLPANFFDSLGTHWCDCKSSQGITEPQQTVSVTVQPNPVINNQFTVTANQSITAIEVVSIVGKTVYSKTLANRQKEVRVVLNEMPDGIYLVKVFLGDNQPVIRKIITQ